MDNEGYTLKNLFSSSQVFEDMARILRPWRKYWVIKMRYIAVTSSSIIDVAST